MFLNILFAVMSYVLNFDITLLYGCMVVQGEMFTTVQCASFHFIRMEISQSNNIIVINLLKVNWNLEIGYVIFCLEPIERSLENIQPLMCVALMSSLYHVETSCRSLTSQWPNHRCLTSDAVTMHLSCHYITRNLDLVLNA